MLEATTSCRLLWIATVALGSLSPKGEVSIDSKHKERKVFTGALDHSGFLILITFNMILKIEVL